jgi:hypothetical protein
VLTEQRQFVVTEMFLMWEKIPHLTSKTLCFQLRAVVGGIYSIIAVVKMGSSDRTKIDLVPWDYASAAHRSRMLAQRQACGWHDDQIDAWAAQSESGERTLYWIVSMLNSE